MQATWLSACQPVPMTPEGPRARRRGIAPHGARRARPQLAQPVGLDEREQLRPVGGEQSDDETRAGAESRRTSSARRRPSSRSAAAITFSSPLQTEPETRPVLDGAARDPREARLDRLDGVAGREQLVDLGLAEVERHGAN